jgi:hypothetical protein
MVSAVAQSATEMIEGSFWLERAYWITHPTAMEERIRAAIRSFIILIYFMVSPRLLFWGLL